MNRLVLILMLLSGVALTACETDHQYDQYIHNNSSQAVTLHYYGTAADQFKDSTVVAADSTFHLHSFYKLGAQPDGISCLPNLDSVVGIAADGKRLVKNFLEEASWTSKVEGKRSVMQECTFEFGDSDLN